MTRMSPEALAQLVGLLNELHDDDRLPRGARGHVVAMRSTVAIVEARGNRGPCGRDGCPCVVLRGITDYDANIYERGSRTDAPRCQGTVTSGMRSLAAVTGRQCSRTAIVEPFYEHGVPGNRLVHYCQQHASRLASATTS